MKKAGVAQLKSSLSEFLAAVKSGEEVVVTERGHPIARIVPLSAPQAESREIQRLVRAGVLRGPKRKLEKSFWTADRPVDSAAAVRLAIQAERDEGR